ncbi:hypothetical protein NP493_1005g00006 [Ridgeia piscesae]|uniref:Reverse transcriptase domain-containing protein n=1 Tax=Ridgeia piscesae TaxID=27915 RepID=A0AAD9KIQ9_RIDPI|nr:hypothetical protein NP493_1005g00006 [Ridgeia piscesae]
MYLISKWWSAFSRRIGKKHSTETALLYVTSAVKTAMDKKQGTILLLVDFSSAFDTINHNILIRRLRLRYGFVGKILDWMLSYLKERTQRVVIGDQSSSTTTLTRGVPQGSVLGPLLFSLYVQPIGDTIRAHELFVHQYADDLHIYAHFDLNHSALLAAVKQMEDCLEEVKVWIRELHWLPIVCRVDFKLLVFTYKAMHNDAPVYLCELVCPYQQTRTLRSANNNTLEVKRIRTKAGDCSFAVPAASLWNNLPTVIKTCDNLTSFKRVLKTHFCHIAY